MAVPVKKHLRKRVVEEVVTREVEEEVPVLTCVHCGSKFDERDNLPGLTVCEECDNDGKAHVAVRGGRYSKKGKRINGSHIWQAPDADGG